MLPVLLTQRAENSLNDIVDYYLTKHSAARASKVVKSIEDGFVAIAKSPHRYPVCLDVAKPNPSIRQFIVHSTFKVIYKIEEDCIFIVEIFHGSRDPELLKV